MITQASKYLLIGALFCVSPIVAQDSNKPDLAENLSELFITDNVLPISLTYSNKDLRKETNDSTYINTYLRYKKDNLEWDSLEVRIRKRGHNRLANCYYVPVKIRIKKDERKNTIFDEHKNLKLVMPCLKEKDKDDNVLKEYLVYKLYEIVSPYHFKARLVDVDFQEEKGKKVKEQQVKGILVEDDKHVAKRVGGKVMDRQIHPLNHSDLESVRNSFFQYMIGNTDYSSLYLHNTKLLYVENQIIPVPYDFDMCGFVHTSYSVVSQINDKQLPIENVTERMYRGYARESRLMEDVRLEFIGKRLDLLAAIKKTEHLFEDPREYEIALQYIESFFDIIMNDNKFQRLIVDAARE